MVGRDELDRELADLPAELRWREWLRRIEAVLFASARPVAREDLARIVGQGASIDLLLEDLADGLAERPYELVRVGPGWLLRTKPAYATAIRAAADAGGQALDLHEFDLAVLAAIALHQPISRERLKDIFGREISRDLIGRLADRDLITTGPREPRRGAPYTFVTTEAFLAAFGIESLATCPMTNRCRRWGWVGREGLCRPFSPRSLWSATREPGHDLVRDTALGP